MKQLTNLVSLASQCQRRGISLRQLCILIIVDQQPTPPSEIAKRLAITPAAMTGQASSLTGLGYVEQAPPPANDARVRALAITPAGKEILQTAAATLLQDRS